MSAAVWLLGAVFTWGSTADHDVANWLALGTAVLLLAALVLILPRRAPRLLELMASGVLLLAAWFHPGLAPAALTALVGIIHAWQHRRPLFAGVSSMPLTVRGLLYIPELLRAAGGWIAVGMAFLLLALGAWLSWRRTRGTPPPAPTLESPTPAAPLPAAPQAVQPFTVEPFPVETPPNDAPAATALRLAPLPSLIGVLACG